MNHAHRRPLPWAFSQIGLLGLLLALQARAADEQLLSLEESQQQYAQALTPFLKKHCLECHGEKEPEKDLNLLALNPDMKASPSAARWAMVLDKVVAGEMPPKGQPQPSPAEVDAVAVWIRAEMKRSGKHLARREAYANGNVVEHQALFGGQAGGPVDHPAGVRRLSPEIYGAFTTDLGKNIPGVGQPFSPSGKTTFKDMGAPKLDEPVTTQLIRNALLIVENKLTAHKVEGGKLQAQMGAPKEIVRLLEEQQPATPEEIAKAVQVMFDLVLRRPPTADETARFTALIEKNIRDAGRITGVRHALAAVLLLPEAVFRSELGGSAPDARGLVRLAPREIAFALAYALTDRRPEAWLLAEADKGGLSTSAGVAAAVHKLLADPKLEKPRIARFFREFFGYDQATEVFKNAEDNREHHPETLVADTARLIDWIVERDEQVFRELLTTNKAFVNYRWDANKKLGVKARNDAVHLSYNLPPDWKWTDQQPLELPAAQRAGVLTQPSWLVAQSKSDENHAILRGKWVRERLLGNVVPDIPITVDAQLPVAPEKTLRERMAVTQDAYCFQCHRLMNNLGYPFESYDHFGRFRTTEPVVDLDATANHVDKKGKALGTVFKHLAANSAGGVEFSGAAQLDGPADGAVALLHKLAASERVEQVFVRHAFRYWMGRNETLGDAHSLQQAHQAYRNNNGSLKALLTSLLTSESFLYRAAPTPP